MKTAVEWLIDEHFGGIENCTPDFRFHIQQAKEMEKEQAELYAEFAVLNDRSENPIIPFNEFINIDNL
jgi:hypothetical protein